VDVNLLDRNQNSTVAHLVRDFDHTGLALLFHECKRHKMPVFTNHKNASGRTPLFLAQMLHAEEKGRFEHKVTRERRLERQRSLEASAGRRGRSASRGAVKWSQSKHGAAKRRARQHAHGRQGEKQEVDRWLYQILLKNGANPNLPCNNQTPLGFALENGALFFSCAPCLPCAGQWNTRKQSHIIALFT